MPRTVPLAMVWKLSGRPWMVLASVITSTTPRAIPNIPSVAMKGGSLNLVTSTPLMMPRTPPTAIPMSMARDDRQASDEQLGGDRAGQAQDGPDGQVDAAGQDDEELADRQDAEDGDLAGQVGEVVAGEEVVAGQGQGADGDQQDDQRAAFAAGDVAQGLDPDLRLRGRRCSRGCSRLSCGGRAATVGGVAAGLFAASSSRSLVMTVVSMGSRHRSLGIGAPSRCSGRMTGLKWGSLTRPGIPCR